MSIQPYLDTYLTRHGVSLDTSSDRELMYALTAAVRDLQKPMGHAQGKRKLYYFSAEFLVGRLLEKPPTARKNSKMSDKVTGKGKMSC